MVRSVKTRLHGKTRALFAENLRPGDEPMLSADKLQRDSYLFISTTGKQPYKEIVSG
jgi:hypothetical protein